MFQAKAQNDAHTIHVHTMFFVFLLAFLGSVNGVCVLWALPIPNLEARIKNLLQPVSVVRPCVSGAFGLPICPALLCVLYRGIAKAASDISSYALCIFPPASSLPPESSASFAPVSH